MALAMLQTWKNARGRSSLPRRQGRGGVRCQKTFDGRKERLTRRYTSEIMPIIGPYQDIPAPAPARMRRSWPGSWTPMP